MSLTVRLGLEAGALEGWGLALQAEVIEVGSW